MENIQATKMRLLLELRDEDIGEKTKPGKLAVREAARAIAMKDGKMAFIHVSKHRYHKLPGGGVERGESVKKALRREMLEEAGCKIKILSEVGKIIEHRTRIGVLQTSYCFIAEFVSQGHQKLERGEKWAGHKLEWKSVHSAAKILQKDKPTTYNGKFIVKRDLAFLKAANAL